MCTYPSSCDSVNHRIVIQVHNNACDAHSCYVVRLYSVGRWLLQFSVQFVCATNKWMCGVVAAICTAFVDQIR